MLQRPISTPLNRNPQNITDEHLNKLGHDYLKKHPEAGYAHTNQPQATELKNYHSETSQSENRWRFLINVFEKLPKPDGNLARSILQYFDEAFSYKLDDEKLNAANHDKKPMSFIATHYLHPAITNYYIDLYRKENQKLHQENKNLLQALSEFKKEFQELKTLKEKLATQEKAVASTFFKKP